jgi:dihydroorotate dehydrogenase
MNLLFKIRNLIISLFYKYFLKHIFFLFDPEKVHDFIIKFGNLLGKNKFIKFLTKILFYYSHPSLNQNILGINFKNPVGLAAGFDKNALLTDIIGDVGFGFSEIGSITGEKCLGNPKPRLWRLKKSKSLVVYYGLKNDGALNIAQRLKNKKFEIPIGISIAKTNSKETVDIKKGIEDYFKTYQIFLNSNIGDYFAINISCPNAFGGEPFTEEKKLEALLQKIMSLPKIKPIFLKISPDLNKNEIDKIINISLKYKIDGFICANVTKNRNNKNIIEKNIPEKGGLSGKAVKDLSNEIISYIYKKTQGKFIIIGVGGIFSGKDAYEKIKLGASLVQLITGMIFEGPQLISQINLELVNLLKKDGYKNISEARGKNIK